MPDVALAVTGLTVNYGGVLAVDDVSFDAERGMALGFVGPHGARKTTMSDPITGLAVVLAHDPSVLLLDEPSSGIAQRETEALGPMLLKIREQTGATMLVIEHDMPLIRAISDEIVALDTGSVLTRGKPDEVLEDPRLVSAYLGTDHQIVQRSGARRTV